MGMKFLNKKGWHTGSLRNIENVWKAEQKHGAEQKKLEELRKQIQEERERAEFRQLQEQAGLVPRQERLEFLYESGLAVGKGSSSSDVVFKALEPSLPLSDNNTVPPPPPSSSAATQQQPLVPGALFEEKPQSANDAWRKLHSDPLLLIRQREQESLARVKNNPVQMAIIRNSVEAKKSKEKVPKSKELREKKRHKKKSKHHKYSSSSEEEVRINDRAGKRTSKGDELSDKMDYVSEREQAKKHRNDSSPSVEEEERSTYTRGGGKSSKSDKTDGISEREEKISQRKNNHHRRRDSSVEEEERLKYNKVAVKSSRRDGRPDKIDYPYERYVKKRNFDQDTYRRDERPDKIDSYEREEKKRNPGNDTYRKQAAGTSLSTLDGETRDGFKRKPKYEEKDMVGSGMIKKMDYEERHLSKVAAIPSMHHRRPHHHVSSSKLSAEERAAKLKEMQMDAEVHEESRWKRIKKADEIDTLQEAAATVRNTTSSNSDKNFLDAAKRSVYGAEKGGSSTIEESVRRRTHFRQSRSEVGQGNAFRR